MKNILTLVTLLSFTLATYGQVTDFQTLSGYNTVNGLVHTKTLLKKAQDFAALHPNILRETGKRYVLDSKGNCKKLKTGTTSTDPFYMPYELERFDMKFKATAYEFEFGATEIQTETSANHVTVGLGNETNYGSTQRVADSTVRTKVDFVQLERSIETTFANLILEQTKGILFSNNATTTDVPGKFYVVVYEALDNCEPITTVYFPVMISTGSPKPTKNAVKPMVFYFATFGGNAPSTSGLEDHMAENHFGVSDAPPPTQQEKIYHTDRDMLTFRFDEGGPGDLFRISVDGKVQSDNVTLHKREEKITVPLTKGKQTVITIEVLSMGMFSGAPFNAVCEDINIHSAYFPLKVGEKIYVTIFRDP